MDPLSITAGIIAVGQVAVKLIKCTEFMYHVSERASPKLAREVNSFAANVDNFTSIITSVHSTISEHYEKSKLSGTLQRLDKFQTLNALAAYVENLIERVEDVQPSVKPGRKGLPFFARFKWLLQIDSRKEIELQMHRVQVTFHLIMHQVNYETLQELLMKKQPQGEIKRLKSKIKQLKRMIKNNIHSVESLKDEQESFGHSGFRQYEEDLDAERAFSHAASIIVKIGNTIVYHKKPSVFFTAPVSSSSDRGKISHGVSPLDILSRQRSPSVQQRKSHQHETQRSTQSLKEPSATRSGSLYPERTADREPHPAISSREVTENHSNIYVSNNRLHLDASHDSSAIAGYINNKGRLFTARINPKSNKSIMARRFAVDLGLQIMPFDDTEDPVEVTFDGSHRESINEKVTFQWKKASGNGNLGLRPLEVTGLVAESPPHTLTLGIHFLESRRRYWGE